MNLIRQFPISVSGADYLAEIGEEHGEVCTQVFDADADPVFAAPGELTLDQVKAVLLLAVADEQARYYVRDVGRALARERERRGLTQAELSRRACVSRRMIIGIEAGENITLHMLALLCIALDIEPEHIGGPGGLLGPLARVVARRLGLDLTEGP